jgi:hypothetical protein
VVVKFVYFDQCLQLKIITTSRMRMKELAIVAEIIMATEEEAGEEEEVV